MLSTHPDLVWATCVQNLSVCVRRTVWSTSYSFDLRRIDFIKPVLLLALSNNFECVTLTFVW